MMYYTPHILYVKRKPNPDYDKNGNPVYPETEWEQVADCFSHDNGQMEKVSINGVMTDFSYHIVYEGDAVNISDEVKCTDKEGNLVSEGNVIKFARCFSPYFKDRKEVWV